MKSNIFKYGVLLSVLACSGCVVDPGPGYVGGGPPVPAPNYGYYGYGPAYAWDSGVSVDIASGYGHGGYYGRGGYYRRGGYGHGGYHGGGHPGGGGYHGGNNGGGWHH